MSWASAIKEKPKSAVVLPAFETETVDWSRLVTLDFETYYDTDYTLSKLSTSEYIRDKRFKAQMVGIKIGLGKTKWYPAHKIKAALRAIPWTTHSLLCHHTQFDAFILSHHYGIQPKKLYCTLSMARGLHSQDIGAGLDEVAKFYGGRGKIEGALELTKGVLNWSPALNQTTGEYCVQDVDEMFRIFQLMLPKMPRDEIDLIDVTCRMFTDPVLLVDIPRVQKELERELAAKKELLLSVVGDKEEQTRQLACIALDAKLRMKKAFAGWLPEEILLEQARAMIGSNDKFAALLRAEGVEPPTKISPAWVKADAAKRLAMEVDNKKTVYAFSQTDLKFMELLETGTPRVRDLVETRLAVKSTTNVTRAQRFLTAGADGAFLPVYLKYAAAHTLRWGGGNKMNMQNLTRGGELRKSIKARKGEVIVVADSGQIEARMNAWLWGQEGLLQSFRVADEYEAMQALLPKEQRKVATGDNRDAYCKFADKIYGREITKHDKDERFVGKVCVLGLGYQMGPPRLQKTLALGTMGPPVFLDIGICHRAVNVYRSDNYKIKGGWAKCQEIIEDMASGRRGAWKCISWEKGVIHLPNGMDLHYPGLRNKSIAARVAQALDPDADGERIYDEWVYIRKGQEVKIYGGLLCENLVQALARIVIGVQLLAISRKYRVVMTTHDEVVTICKAAQGQKCFDFMHKCMSTTLPWCRDLPLNAEGGFDVIYSK